jgi:putative transposase
LSAYLLLFCSVLCNLVRPRRDLALENLALRHQLLVLNGSSRRARLAPADRFFWARLSRRWSSWRSALVLVQPDTVVRWHLSAWKRYWTWKSRRRHPGRPRLAPEVRALIHRLAQENPRWGSVRIRGELRKLGYEADAETVRRYRRRARRRPPTQSWRTFLRNHAPHIWAADFFTVPTVRFQTLHVFFFISHGRRQLVHLNVTAYPTAEWVWRQLIQATPWAEQPRYLIRDRCYGGAFIPRAARLGIETLLTPVQAPKANAIAERLVGTLRRECLDHFIIINERHLRRILKEYAAHYNRGRQHRSLDLVPPSGIAPVAAPGSGRVTARPVLGGLLYEYQWEAA